MARAIAPISYPEIMKLEDILPTLQSWFLPQEHKERKLPGGGRWFYVPHQTITQRLNDVCPGEWHSEPIYPTVAGDYTVVYCKLTICGVVRTGIGDDKTFPDTNDEGKSKVIGTPPVRAWRNAFKDACEQFGICAYLDEQKGDRQAFIKYMQSKGDGRAIKFAAENGWTGNSEPVMSSNGAIGRDKLMLGIDQEMKRIGWTSQQGREYLQRSFAGVTSRDKLTNNQLSQFLGYLKEQQPVSV